MLTVTAGHIKHWSPEICHTSGCPKLCRYDTYAQRSSELPCYTHCHGKQAHWRIGPALPPQTRKCPHPLLRSPGLS